MTNIASSFWNAEDAFVYLYDNISKHGVRFADTRAVVNV